MGTELESVRVVIPTAVTVNDIGAQALGVRGLANESGNAGLAVRNDLEADRGNRPVVA